MRNRNIIRICLLASILITVIQVYAQFLGNPTVFDDVLLFLNIYDHAQTIFSVHARTFPYFSIGFIEVLSNGDIRWNRWVNIALFCCVIVALYFFLQRSITCLYPPEKNKLPWPALLTCLWFALNPIAVYAVGYLAQRTILMATLFSILAANMYLRAQEKERNADIASATLFGALAMMCKEHAVLIPVAAIALTPLVCDWNRNTILRAISFLIFSFPVSYWIIENRTNIIGISYEPYAGEIIDQISLPALFNFSGGVWVMSVATQLGVFLKYAVLWLAPSPSFLSVDMRIDFSQHWMGIYGISLALLTLILGCFSLWVTFNNKHSTIVRCLSAAFLYFATLYATELSTIRVQEPFVLYRSFLWAPAYALVVCGLISAFFQRTLLHPSYWRIALIVVLTIGSLGLIPWTQDRLETFSSEAALWQDAYNKLPSPTVAGADRIYYNLAGEAFKQKKFEEALAFSEKVLQQNPKAFQGYLAKGTSLLALGDTQGAMEYFNHADAHPHPIEFRGYIQFKRCSVYEKSGKDREQVIDCLKESSKMGYGPAETLLKIMGKLP